MKKNLNNLINWLTLWHAPQITPHRFYKWLKIFKNFDNLKKASHAQLQHYKIPKASIEYIRQPSLHQKEIDKILKWSEQKHCYAITFEDTDYPSLLKEIKNAPPILFIKGNIDLLSTPQIAIVGSRHATPIGLEFAQTLSSQLSNAGLTITSGLALGIDAASHLGTLKENGNTIAVLGTGIEKIYPYRNKKIAEEIIEKGALVSEFPINSPPKREHFPQRNRIISGLSLGTIVIEANFKSGSLITAHFAADQGREVFAVPGSIKNPLTQGCHALIQKGAKLVTKIQDVLEELKTFDYVAHEPKSTQSTERTITLSQSEEELLDCLGYEPTSIDEIKQRSNLEIKKINTLLCSLKFKGYIDTVFNQYIKTK